MSPPSPAPAAAPREHDAGSRLPAAAPAARSRGPGPPSGRALAALRTPAARLRDHDPAPPSGLDAEVVRTLRAPGLGEPLLPAIRARLEHGLGVDLGALRIHTGERAQAAARRLGARAFTVGRRVYLGERATVHDETLMAHEAAHAVQQQSAPALQRASTATSGGGMLEREAATAGQTIAAGGTARIAGRAAAGAPQHADEDEGWFARRIMNLVRGHAPWLVPIIQKGPLNWLVEQVTDGLRALVDVLMAPVRAATAAIGEVKEHVASLVTWVLEIGGQLAKGDCSGLAAAAGKVQKVAEALASPALRKIRDFAEKVGAFFTGLWADYGKPAWDWLTQTAGRAVEAVTSFVTRLWDATAPVRDLIGWAWHWLLRKIGIEDAESADDQGGLMAWLKRKAGEAWDAVKAKLEPYKKQIAVVAGIVLLLSPVGPIIVIAAAAAGLIKVAMWLAKTFSKPAGIVSERRTLLHEIAPLIKRVTAQVTQAVAKAAAWLVETLTGVVKGLRGAAGTLGESLLRFLVFVVDWLLEHFQVLLAWATEKVTRFAELVARALDRIVLWLQPVLRVLDKVGAVLENILELMFLIAEKAWNAIPPCIRDPITNFLVEHLLKKIPILKEILEVPDVWAKIKEVARTIIRKIFRGGLDIAGAALAIFKFLLEVLKVPWELVVSIFKKAGAAIDQIVDKPVQFLKNLLKALAAGFKGFGKNALEYLVKGIVGWIVGQLPTGVRAPIPFTIGNVFRFVVDVLGITMERVWKVVQRVAPQAYTALRAAGSALATAWDWLSTAFTEGVEGLWKRFTEKIDELKDTVVSAISGFLFTHIVEKAAGKLLSMLDPTGIMAVVNSILFVYDTIRSAIEYMARILAIIDDFLTSVLELAAGSIGAAAQRIEKGLAAAVPVAVGFLANVMDLGRLSAKVREAIGKLQDWVEQRIEALVKRAVAIGGAILKGVGKLLGFDVPSHGFSEKDGHMHTIAFPEGGLEPTVASARARAVMEFLEEHGDAKDKSEAQARLDAMKPLVVKIRRAKSDKSASVLELQKQVRDEEVKLGAILARVFDRNRSAGAADRWKLEGTTGTHSSMQFPGDRMEADHQPHFKLLEHVADLFPGGAKKGIFLFEGKGLRKPGLYGRGYTIVLGLPRHRLGRTHGSKSHSAFDEAMNEVAEYAKKPDEDAQRRAVIAGLTWSMKADAREMEDVITMKEAWPDIVLTGTARDKLIEEVRKQIKQGLERVRTQPIRDYGA